MMSYKSIFTNFYCTLIILNKELHSRKVSSFTKNYPITSTFNFHQTIIQDRSVFTKNDIIFTINLNTRSNPNSFIQNFIISSPGETSFLHETTTTEYYSTNYTITSPLISIHFCIDLKKAFKFFPMPSIVYS